MVVAYNRSIVVSADVFAAIWRARIDEEDENSILRRVLQSKKPTEKTQYSFGGVEFEDGFKIFKKFRGHYYDAEMKDFQWHLSEKDSVRVSLHESMYKLTMAVTKGVPANTWTFWSYADQSGTNHRIEKLRRLK